MLLPGESARKPILLLFFRHVGDESSYLSSYTGRRHRYVARNRWRMDLSLDKTAQESLLPTTFRLGTCALGGPGINWAYIRSEEHTSELQSLRHLVCRL